VRPVLVGLNNPHSDDPEKALATDRHGSSGYKLWLMLKEAANRNGQDLSEADYLARFNRINLTDAIQFNVHVAKARVPQLIASFRYCRVVLCGTRVPMILGLKHTGFHLGPQHGKEFAYYVIPHPSGLCREYNDPNMREAVGNLLFTLYKG